MSHRILLPVFAIPLVVACTEPVDPAPPKPLAFAGPTLGDGGFAIPDTLFATAVGGTQHVEIFDEESGEPLVGQYVARSDADGVRVASSDKNVVTLVGDAADEGTLEIASTDGTPLDSIAIAAAPIATASLSWRYLGEIAPRANVKLLTGVPHALVVSLRDADGDSLVDESARIRLNGAGQGFEQTSWDSFELARVPAGTTSTSFSVISGTRTMIVSVATVDAVDSIELSGPAVDVNLDSATNVCFTARSGDAHVLGAPWEFTATGGIELVDRANPDDEKNCALVHTTSVGPATVTAKVGALTASTTFEVRAP